MLIIKTDQPNSMVVTVSQNSELPNPEYLFSFVHIFSKERLSFIPIDVSTHKSRYDEFYFVEGSGVGEINFPYSGQYLYTISEQPAGSGNLDPALATNVVENGEAQIIVQSAITQDSQYEIFISNDEFDSNIIFAPDEPNPIPAVTPSITPTNTITPSITPTNTITPSITPTNTLTPSITPTNTPTPTITPSEGTTATPTPTPTLTPTPSSTPLPVEDPSQLGATWWVDYTDSNNVILDNSYSPPKINAGRDLISNNFIFSAQTGTGPDYSGTGYNNLSGINLGGGNGISNALGTFSGASAYTLFMNVNLVAPFFSAPVRSDNQQNYLGQQQGYRWFSVDNGFPSDSVRCYSFSTGGNSTNPEVRFDLLNEGWNFVAVRVYASAGNFITELWVNGNNVDDTTMTGNAPIFASNPIFVLGDVSPYFYTAETYFFDRALTDTDMNKSFNYLNSKYPLQ